MDNRLFIVFGFEHYNPLGIVRSLGETGIKPIAIVIKGKRAITSKSKYISKLFFVNDVEEGYKLLLSKYSGLELKPFVYASDDKVTNYMDAKYEELKDKFYFYNAGETGRIAQFQNKDNILKLAQKHGLGVLKTFTVKKGEIPEGIEYPIITKAIISTIDLWKEDMIICHNEEELKQAYKKIRSERVLLQKYIEKKNELCLEGYSVDRGNKAVITIASTYNYQLKDSYSPYMTCRSLNNPELERKLAAMIQEVGFEGIFEIEFLVDQDDELYFLEINFRNSTWSYASTIAGMPMPVLWAKGMIDPKAIDGTFKEINEPFTAMVEFDDHRRRVKTGQMSNWAWFKDFRNAKCKYYCASGDLAPVLSVVMSKFNRVIGRE